MKWSKWSVFATGGKWKIDSKEWLVKNQEQKEATWHKYGRLVRKWDIDKVTHRQNVTWNTCI